MIRNRALEVTFEKYCAITTVTKEVIRYRYFVTRYILPLNKMIQKSIGVTDSLQKM